MKKKVSLEALLVILMTILVWSGALLYAHTDYDGIGYLCYSLGTIGILVLILRKSNKDTLLNKVYWIILFAGIPLTVMFPGAWVVLFFIVFVVIGIFRFKKL